LQKTWAVAWISLHLSASTRNGWSTDA
jgi:hypothetical protein